MNPSLNESAPETKRLGRAIFRVCPRGAMRTLARQYHATELVQKAVLARNGKDSTQYREANDYR
jgi:hypothetical protein